MGVGVAAGFAETAGFCVEEGVLVAAGFCVALAVVFPGFRVGTAPCVASGETDAVALGDRTGIGEISDDGLALDNGLFEDAEGWLLQPAKTQSNTPTAKNCAIRFIGLLLSLIYNYTVQFCQVQETRMEYPFLASSSARCKISNNRCSVSSASSHWVTRKE